MAIDCRTVQDLALDTILKTDMMVRKHQNKVWSQEDRPEYRGNMGLGVRLGLLPEVVGPPMAGCRQLKDHRRLVEEERVLQRLAKELCGPEDYRALGPP